MRSWKRFSLDFWKTSEGVAGTKETNSAAFVERGVEVGQSATLFRERELLASGKSRLKWFESLRDVVPLFCTEECL